MNKQMVTIYALCDPDTDEVRYIGQTIDEETRLRGHIDGSFTGKTKRDKWIRGLLRNGKHPQMKILDVVPAEQADQTEVDSIRKAKEKGCNLANGHDRAIGGVSKRPSRVNETEITFKVGAHTIRGINALAEKYGSRHTLLMLLIDRALRAEKIYLGRD